MLDICARQLADKLAGPLGLPVIVENKGGGGGILAMEATANSAPDASRVTTRRTGVASGSIGQ